MPSRIHFFKEEVAFRLQNKSGLLKWIKRVIANEGKKPGAINFIFCSDKYLLGINRQYLKHDYFTDIITFHNNTDDLLNGDIYISIERVKENAINLDVAFHVELSRVMIHGVLHLLGYSDKTAARKKQMRKQEDACLSLLARFT